MWSDRVVSPGLLALKSEAVISPEDVDGMANSVDPDQTAPFKSRPYFERVLCPGKQTGSHQSCSPL